MVSVVVPVSDRVEALDQLYQEYSRPLRDAQLSFEIEFVVEPWLADRAAGLLGLEARGEPVRTLRLAQPAGEGALVKVGAERARGDVILILPAYRRVESSVLPTLVDRVRAGADVAVARRWPRRDPWWNRLQHRMFHTLLRPLTHDRLHDVACGVSAVRKEVLLALPLYGDFFRFLPLLAAREGYAVEEVVAEQHPADRQLRVHRPATYVRRLLDLLGLFFLLRFTEKPLRFFGAVGGVLGLAGSIILGILLVQRLGGVGIANRPLLLLGVLLLVLGLQAIALGLVAEIIVHLQASSRRVYRLASTDTPGSPQHSPPGGSA